MISWRLPIIIGVFGMFWAHSTFAEQPTPDQIKLLDETAQSICNRVKEIRGTRSDTEVRADVQARLKGLSSKLLDAGAGAQGSVKSWEFEGLTQDATALAVEQAGECRERLFQHMYDKILEQHGEKNQSPVQPAYDPKRDQQVVGKYFNTEYARVSVGDDSLEIMRKDTSVISWMPEGTMFRVRLRDVGEFRNNSHCAPNLNKYDRDLSELLRPPLPRGFHTGQFDDRVNINQIFDKDKFDELWSALIVPITSPQYLKAANDALSHGRTDPFTWALSINGRELATRIGQLPASNGNRSVLEYRLYQDLERPWMRSEASKKEVPAWCDDNRAVMPYLEGRRLEVILLRCLAGSCVEQLDSNGGIENLLSHVVIFHRAKQSENTELEVALSKLINYPGAR
jgi:hypothetical protein